VFKLDAINRVVEVNLFNVNFGYALFGQSPEAAYFSAATGKEKEPRENGFMLPLH